MSDAEMDNVVGGAEELASPDLTDRKAAQLRKVESYFGRETANECIHNY